MAKIKEKIIKNKMGEFIIKTPGKEDAEVLIEFVKQADLESEFLLREPEEFNITVEKEEGILERMNDSEKDIFITVFHEDKAIANLGFSGNGRKRLKHHGRFGIAILKEYWGIGLGSVLMEEMIEWANQNSIEKITLEVDEDNERGLALYKKYGFKEEGLLIKDKKMKDGRYKNTILMGRFNE